MSSAHRVSQGWSAVTMCRSTGRFHHDSRSSCRGSLCCLRAAWRLTLPGSADGSEPDRLHEPRAMKCAADDKRVYPPNGRYQAAKLTSEGTQRKVTQQMHVLGQSALDAYEYREYSTLAPRSFFSVGLELRGSWGQSRRAGKGQVPKPSRDGIRMVSVEPSEYAQQAGPTWPEGVFGYISGVESRVTRRRG